MYLLSAGDNPKTAKSDKLGQYLTAIQYLLPGSKKICPKATAGCRSACLHTAGHPMYLEVKTKARTARTEFFENDFSGYRQKLFKEIAAHVRKSERLGVSPAVRLNGTSDIVWEIILPEVFDTFKGVQFYDYSKIAARFRADWAMPSNYHLTFSHNEENDGSEVIENGGTVAIVFDLTPKMAMVSEYRGIPVDDGDTHDLTFLRAPGYLGLRAKGLARRDDSGFVVKIRESVKTVRNSGVVVA